MSRSKYIFFVQVHAKAKLSKGIRNKVRKDMDKQTTILLWQQSEEISNIRNSRDTPESVAPTDVYFPYPDPLPTGIYQEYRKHKDPLRMLHVCSGTNLLIPMKL